MTSNTFTVITTTEAARIGDVVVATNRNNTAEVERGRLVDVRIDELILEKDNGYRVALPFKEWSFTSEPPAPAAFEAADDASAARASKPEDVTPTPSVEEIARVIYLHGVYVSEPSTVFAVCVAPECSWTSDLKGIDLRDAFNTHLAEVIRTLYAAGRIEDFEPGHSVVIEGTRYYHVGKIQADLEKSRAEVGRLAALVDNKQAVINEDRADAKRNRDLQAAEVADLRHALALEIDRTNDANQRADQLAARVQELEVKAARYGHALEKADELIQALRHRYGTHVTVGEAQKDDDRAARLIREADEQNSAARGALAEICAVKAAAPPKFGKFEPADLGAYTEAVARATRLAVAAAAKERGRGIRSQDRNPERTAAAEVRDAAPEAEGIDA